MAKLLIILGSYFNQKSDAQEYLKSFDNFSMKWLLFDEEKTIIPKISIVEEHNDSFVRYDLRIEINIEFGGQFSENRYIYPHAVESLLYHQEFSKLMDELDSINPLSNIAEFDAHSKEIFKISDIIREHDKKYTYHSEQLDDFYYENLKPYIAQFIITIQVAYPKIPLRGCPVTIKFDGITDEINEIFIDNPLNESLPDEKEYSSLFEHQVHIQEVWDWFIRKAHFFESPSEKNKPAKLIAALSYILNRTSKESLLFSVIGLESIYITAEKRKEQQLKENIRLIFPEISEADIHQFYKLRSKFVHGEISFSNFYLELSEFSDYQKYDKISKKASCLVLATIQKLAENNASSIVFSNPVRYI